MKRAQFWLGLILIAVMAAVSVAPVFAGTPYVDRISKEGMSKESLVLVSWNAGNFGKSKQAATLAFMAKLLRDADIVALQEVSTGDVGAFTVAKLTDELSRTGAKWDYVVSDPTVGPGTERFAFLFRTDKLWINRDDNKLTASLRDSLDREPAIMTFHAGDKKFSVASFHLQPNNKRDGKDPRIEVAAIGKNPGELLNGPMIMVGDFNLPHRELDGVFEKTLDCKHNIEGKTSLKRRPDKKGRYLESEYDNIYTRGVTVHGAAIYDFVPFVGKNLKKARKVSDHLPVFIVFTP